MLLCLSHLGPNISNRLLSRLLVRHIQALHAMAHYLFTRKKMDRQFPFPPASCQTHSIRSANVQLTRLTLLSGSRSSASNMYTIDPPYQSDTRDRPC
jgi:hypothetical protein